MCTWIKRPEYVLHHTPPSGADVTECVQPYTYYPMQGAWSHGWLLYYHWNKGYSTTQSNMMVIMDTTQGILRSPPDVVNEMNQNRRHNLFYSLSRDDFTLISQHCTKKFNKKKTINGLYEHTGPGTYYLHNLKILSECKHVTAFLKKKTLSHTQAILI
jgi:hypothetical protein